MEKLAYGQNNGCQWEMWQRRRKRKTGVTEKTNMLESFLFNRPKIQNLEKKYKSAQWEMKSE